MNVISCRRIRELRKKILGLSQKQFAKLLWVSVDLISIVERERQNPSEDLIRRIQRATGVAGRTLTEDKRPILNSAGALYDKKFFEDWRKKQKHDAEELKAFAINLAQERLKSLLDRAPNRDLIGALTQLHESFLHIEKTLQFKPANANGSTLWDEMIRKIEEVKFSGEAENLRFARRDFDFSSPHTFYTKGVDPWDILWLEILLLILSSEGVPKD